MKDTTGMLSILCYETASTLPFHLIAYVPFWNHLRLKKKPAVFILIAAQLLYMAVFLVCFQAGIPAVKAQMFSVLLYTPLFFYMVRLQKGKVAFLYVFTTDYLMIVKGAASFLGSSLLHIPPFSLQAGLVILLLFFSTMPVMLRYMKSTAEMVFSIDADIWKSVWLLPLFNSVIVLLYTYPVENGSVRMLAARTLLMLCMFLIYHLLVRSIRQTQEQTIAEERSRSMESLVKVQADQYALMQSRIAETKRARHDLRHHWQALQSYVDNGDIKAMRAYITKYGESLPKEPCVSYCIHPAVNALLCFYAQKAAQAGIDVQISFPVKDQAILPEPELCVLLGNLLENALEACLSCEGRRFIRVNGMMQGKSTLVLTVDNTGPEPEREGNAFYSSKRDGFGIGTESVRMIVRRYHGDVRFEWNGGVFYASVMLKN